MSDVELPPNHLPERSVERSREFLNDMSSRRSIRQFSDRPIPLETILNAVRTAGSGPSGANCQPWFFAVIRSEPMKKRIREEAEKVETIFYESKASQEWLNDLKPFATTANKPYLVEAPYLIAIFSKHRVSRENGEPQTYYPLESVGIATGLLLASLHLAGLSTLTHTPKPMGFLNECLGLDRSYRPFLLVVTGYAARDARPPELSRRSLDEICRLY